MDLAAIQSALRERNIDAWLFYDHHYRDPIAYRVLGLPANLMVTRRWFYLVPAQGEPARPASSILCPAASANIPDGRNYSTA
jgi:Xaa-Pro dipeptidase